MEEKFIYNRTEDNNVHFKFWIWALIAIVPIAFFFSITHEVLTEKETQVDNSIISYVGSHFISPALTSVMKAFTFMGSSIFLTAATLLITIFFIIKRKYIYALYYSLGSAGAAGLVYLTKLFYHRQRPITPLLKPLKTYSIPSGHSAMSLVFFSLLVFIIWHATKVKWLRWSSLIIAIIFVLCIGFSRIYLRMHYPSDVIGGYCEALVWLLLMFVIYRMKVESY